MLKQKHIWVLVISGLSIVGIIVGVVAIGIFVLLIRTATEATPTEVKTEAAPLVQAINNYRVVNGYAPKTLDDLVPKFIAKLPPPPRGTRWEYRAYGLYSEKYTITVRLRSQILWYHDTTGKWSAGDASLFD